MLPMNKVREWSANVLHARHSLFILDACFGGFVGMQAKGNSEPQTLERLRQPGHYFVTGGDENEQTYGADGRSLFTDAFLRAAWARVTSPATVWSPSTS